MSSRFFWGAFNLIGGYVAARHGWSAASVIVSAIGGALVFTVAVDMRGLLR